ncbi:MAG: nuclear transport factor 2 family protein [Bacteroidota bacterium]|nr:nuclear transport factor 2 family protein [Bacteroidota bacterium]
MKSQLIALFTVSSLFFIACSPAPAPEKPNALDMDALRVEIQAMEDAYSEAEKAKNADGVAAYYSDDAVSYSRNMEPLTGKEAIKNRIAERLANDSSGVVNVYKVVDLFAEGDNAVEIGSWKEINASGEEISHGHYMSYFEKRDGKYVCVRDMNATSMPMSTKN